MSGPNYVPLDTNYNHDKIIYYLIPQDHRNLRHTARGDSFVCEVWRSLLNPSLLLLSLAGGVRQGAGLVWSYNVKSYFSQYDCSSFNVGSYLSWVPLVGGTLGALLGGLVSDRLVRKKGQLTRLWVLIVSQLLAVPFLVGAVLLPPNPWAFLCLLPAYVVGEVWIGVCLAVVIEMVPRRVVAVAIAFFLFVINNIGALLPLLIPALESGLELRYILLLLFPGSYLLAAILFAATLALLMCGRWCCDGGHDTLCRPFIRATEGNVERDLLIQQVHDDISSSDLLQSCDSVAILHRPNTTNVRHSSDS